MPLGSRLVVLGMSLLVAGCAKCGYLSSALFSPPARTTLELHDGERRDFYSFDTRGASVDSYLIFIGGSGCSSLRYYLKRYFKGLRPGVRVLALQKAHVRPMGTGSSCSREFDADDTLPNWIADQTWFLQRVLGASGERPRNVVVFGVSEGGDVAAAVSSRVAAVTHLVVVGSGGMRAAEALQANYPAAKQRWPAFEVALRQDPASIDKRFLGQTFRYWSAVLPHDPMPDYLSLDIPILVALGENDGAIAVEAGRRLADPFERAGKSNLRVIIYPNSNHQLEEPDGTKHRPDLLRELNALLSQPRAASARR